MPPLQFAVQSYQAESLPVSAQRVVNLYAELSPPDAKNPVALHQAPGITAFATIGTGPIRGGAILDGLAYFVSGEELYEVAGDGTTTLLGAIKGFPKVSMAENDVGQLCIVNGAEGYIYTTTGGLVQITDPDFLPADTVTYQDGYFVFHRTGTSDFFISNLNNGFAYLGTDIASAEGKPDNLVNVTSIHRELWAFGEETIEVFYNSGNLDFPFERIAGSIIERGCAARLSPARIDNTLVWLGEDRIVYRAEGYGAKRISQHAIEQAIQKYPVISDAFAMSHTVGGHKFYVLTFPTENQTWAWDAATNLWHERESLRLQVPLRWHANSLVEAYGKQLVGDEVTGQIGELDQDIYTEYGATMQGTATAPEIHFDRKRVFISRFEMDVESGVGLTTGQGDNPLIQLDWTDDGGRTFSSRKPYRSLGKIGAYRQRLRWLRMGQSRNRIFRIFIADPVKRTIISAHLDLQTGLS